MVEGTLKKGLRNPLEEAQVRRAVLALQAFVAKRNSERTKTPLVESAPMLSCILTRKLVPAKASLKPITIDLPHALHDEGAEMCLFVKDEDKKRIKEALAADPVPGLTKVMAVKKLRKNFSRFEDKRALAGAYDLFLADDRVLPYLKGPLGTKFFAKKKQPMAVRVSRKDVSFSVRAAVRRTAFHVSAGACANVKVARLDMAPEEIVENVLVAMNNCAAHIPKGWHGVQSISIKTDDSLALPVYNALAPLAKLPPVGKKSNLKKRKLEEVVAEADAEAEEQETEAPKAKKSKKTAAKPVKKETKKKAKKETPAKEAEPVKEATKKTKKAKKETPTKEVVKKTKKSKKATEAAKEETPAPKKPRTRSSKK